MAHSLEWVDSDGAASLSNLKATPGDRFGGWTPKRLPIGPGVIGLGTGRLHRFEFRRDDVISFEIAAIPESELELMLRLQYHLLNGGIVSLTTDRPLAESFATCALAPETEPLIDFSDRQNLEHTFSVLLKAVTPTAADIISPAFVPGLVRWGRADALLGTKIDGDFVSSSTDMSGLGNHAVQATGSKQPTFREDVVNGQPVLEFDAGTGDHLLTPTIINPCTAGATFFLFARLNGTATEHGNFFGFTDSTGENASSSRIYSRDGGDAGKLRYAINQAGGVVDLSASGANAWFILGLKMVSAASVIPYFNSLTPSTAFDPNNSLDVLKRLCIGRDNVVSGNTGNNQIAEDLLYEGVLSTANINVVINYLASKYALTLV